MQAKKNRRRRGLRDVNKDSREGLNVKKEERIRSGKREKERGSGGGEHCSSQAHLGDEV